jgi:hypothetical protein
MALRRVDPHTLAGAYVMDAVTPGDRARFARHLAGCESCRQEIQGLREVTGRLAAAVAVTPPDAMRDTALASVARTRQLPPAVSAVPAPWRARLAPGRRWLPRLAPVLAAALAVVAVFLGLANHGMSHRLNADRQHSRMVATVLGAPDATMLTAQVRTGGSATVVMSHRERRLVFTVAGLRALPGGKRYELWLMGPAGDRSAGMLPAGRAGPMIVSGLDPGDQVGLTVESGHGAARPTLPAVLLLSLTSP